MRRRPKTWIFVFPLRCITSVHVTDTKVFTSLAAIPNSAALNSFLLQAGCAQPHPKLCWSPMGNLHLIWLKGQQWEPLQLFSRTRTSCLLQVFLHSSLQGHDKWPRGWGPQLLSEPHCLSCSLSCIWGIDWYMTEKLGKRCPGWISVLPLQDCCARRAAGSELCCTAKSLFWS